MECFSLAFNMHTQCTNTKGTKLRSLEVFSFHCSYLAFLKDASLWKAVPKHSRSNLVFDLRNILYFRNALLRPGVCHQQNSATPKQIYMAWPSFTKIHLL